MLNTMQEEVRCLVLPLAGGALLVPNTCIAEVAAYAAPSPVEAGREWLLGTVEWRGLRMPLVSFEALRGGPLPEAAGRARIAVFNSVGAAEEVSFYGVLLQDIPRLQRVVVEELAAGSAEGPYTIAETVIAGQVLTIPDLDGLEREVGKVQF